MAERILDEQFEKEMKEKMDAGLKDAKQKIDASLKDTRGKMDSGLKDARGKMDSGLKDARVKAETARESLESGEEEVAEKIREHPLKWVAGAFIAGLLVGKILSK